MEILVVIAPPFNTREFFLEQWQPGTLSNHLFFNGCFNWMTPNHYIKNDCLTKQPFNNCLEFRAGIFLVAALRGF